MFLFIYTYTGEGERMRERQKETEKNCRKEKSYIFIRREKLLRICFSRKKSRRKTQTPRKKSNILEKKKINNLKV